mmetsp:Transcript_48257/g.114830  ORF Transcript_48257/g.114830 Transcript_48257/m.114830 type:complete len:244 (+) Transcript_48257:1115-1846(+)
MLRNSSTYLRCSGPGREAMWGYSRRIAWSARRTICVYSSRFQNSSSCANRMKLLATRHMTAPCSCFGRFGGYAKFPPPSRSSTPSPASRPSAVSRYHARMTVSPDATTDRARVVPTPRWCIASDCRNSRMHERRTARPSNRRENGVRPHPLSCSSKRSPGFGTTSAMLMARPSPSCPNHVPACEHPYTVAHALADPGTGAFPPMTAANSSEEHSAGSRPMSVAHSGENATIVGARTGSGFTRV